MALDFDRRVEDPDGVPSWIAEEAHRNKREQLMRGLAEGDPELQAHIQKREQTRDADWPEWVVIGAARIHWPSIAYVYVWTGPLDEKEVHLDTCRAEMTGMILRGDDAAKFLAWWNAREQRDDVVVL
jgi:hypothetical protein